MKNRLVKLTVLCFGLAIVSLMFTCLSEAKIDPGSIVGIWYLDEKDEADDASPNGYDGEIIGAAAWDKGKFGDAMEFDGATHVAIEDNDGVRLGKDQTITLWLYPSEGIGDWARLVGKGAADPRNYGLWREANGWALYQIYAAGGAGNSWQSGKAETEMPLEEWTHLAGTYDGKSMKLFVNGKEVFDAPFGEDPHTSEDPLTFGAAVSMHGFFKGLIDDIGIFNAPLDIDDIKDIMDNGLGAATGFSPVEPKGKLAITWGEIKE